MSEKLFYSRKFLNAEEYGGSAFVEARIGEVETNKHNATQHVEAQFSISDCSRVITLDFDAYGPERLPELREKIARLRQVVVAFEKVLLEQYKGVKA